MKPEGKTKQPPSLTIPLTEGDRLRLLMNENNKTGLDVGALISNKIDDRGYPASRSQVSNWLNNKVSIPEIALRKLEDNWLWSREYIRHGKLPKYVRAARPDFTAVPILRAEGLKKMDQQTLENPGTWTVRHRLPGSYDNDVIVVEMPSNSMSTTINKHALIQATLLDRSQWDSVKNVVVICSEGKIIIRRVETINEESIYLKPDNPRARSYIKKFQDIAWIAQANKIIDSVLE